MKAEIPGLDPDKDVEIDISDHTLRLRAERRQETEVEEKGGYRSAFRYGSSFGTVPLPTATTDEDVKASYREGILEVRIPVDQKKAAATKIPVQRT